MPRILSRLTLAVLLLAAVVTACDDDDTLTGPASFRVVLEVVDPNGRPVPGLELGMAPDTPWYMDGTTQAQSALVAADQLQQPFPNPFFPAITISIQLDMTSEVSLTVEDVEGATLRTLVDGQMESGKQTFVWDGRDASGEKMPSGVYTAHLVVRSLGSEAVRLDDSRRTAQRPCVRRRRAGTLGLGRDGRRAGPAGQADRRDP